MVRLAQCRGGSSGDTVGHTQGLAELAVKGGNRVIAYR